MKKNTGAFISIFLLSFFLVFFLFNKLPENLAIDEIDFAKLALSLQNKPYIPYSPLATGHSTLYFYIILFSFRLFGVSNFALRLPSAIFGLINPLIFYLIIKRQFNNQKQHLNFLPLFLTFIFVSLHWYFNFARFAFEGTFLLFLELAAIYFLPSNLILSGIFSGLAFNSYITGRLFFIVPLFFLITKKISFRKILYFLIPFIITIFPLTFYLLNHKDIRVAQQLFITHNLTISKKTQYLIGNIKSAILMFNFKGDLNGRHNWPGKPALNPLLSVFFIFGFITTIFKYKKSENRFYLLYFFLSLLPVFFTYPDENPNMLRTFTAIPATIFFIGVALSWLCKKIEFLKLKKYTLLILALIVVISSAYEVRTYFLYQSQIFSEAFIMKQNIGETLINKK